MPQGKGAHMVLSYLEHEAASTNQLEALLNIKGAAVIAAKASADPTMVALWEQVRQLAMDVIPN